MSWDVFAGIHPGTWQYYGMLAVCIVTVVLAFSGVLAVTLD